MLGKHFKAVRTAVAFDGVNIPVQGMNLDQAIMLPDGTFSVPEIRTRCYLCASRKK
jgi:hypothetical protein